MAESKRICCAPDCGNPAVPGRKGMCMKHYKRVYKHGSVDGFAAKPERPICKVESCNRVTTGLGFCNSHYKRFVKWGDTLAGGMKPGTQQAWLRDNATHQGDCCLTWPFARDRNGYGKVYFEGIGTSAHRVMCTLAHGKPDDPSKHAAHTCHNGHLGCVNPRHLVWMEAKLNQADKPRLRARFQRLNSSKP